MRVLRPLLIVCVLGALSALLPTGANAWNSNSFRTPSGNIRCEFFGSGISCGTLNDGYTLTLYRYGRTAVGIDNVYTLRRGPVLPYGSRWRSRFITCESFFSGLQCQNRLGHGFFLNRDEVQRW